MRGMLVDEQDGLALLDDNIGVQRLADDAERPLGDRQLLLRGRFLHGSRDRLGFQLRFRPGSRSGGRCGGRTRLRQLDALLRGGLGPRDLHRGGQDGLRGLGRRRLRGLAAVFGRLHALVEARLRRLDRVRLDLRLGCGGLLFGKLPPGRPAALFSVDKTAWCTASKTSRSERNLTSVLAGWTFTSTACTGISISSTQAGKRPTMIWLRYASSTAAESSRDLM